MENILESGGILQTGRAGATQEPPSPTGLLSEGPSGKTTGRTYHVLLELKPPLSPLLVFLHTAVQVCKFWGSFLRNRSTWTAESDGGGHWKETQGPLVSGTEPVHKHWVPCKTKRPPAGSGLNYIRVWLACRKWSNCNKVCWSQIILFSPCFVRRTLLLAITYKVVNIRQATPKAGDNFYVSWISLRAITCPGNEDLFLSTFCDFLIWAWNTCASILWKKRDYFCGIS